MPQIRDARLGRNQGVVAGGRRRFNDETIGVSPGMQCAALVRVSDDPERPKLMTNVLLREHFGWEGLHASPGLGKLSSVVA